MVRSFMSRFGVFFLLVGILFSMRVAYAQQVLPRAGQNFTFGIMLGPDHLLADSTAAATATTLTLTVVSAYAGCGVITSPSGYLQDFSFIPGTATIIELPYRLLQLNDLGKSNKGLLVHTTEPVNLVLHDYVVEAGDASQILPDGALDTSYVAFGWGIWDDPLALVPERNCNEFLVTAANDSTLVTITPSISSLNGLLPEVPLTVLLNRGECYIVKADTSNEPSDPSLSGSTIHATKPVSVMSGLTCGYVPVGEQSCNELMDELIGKKWWGSHFFVQPLGNSDSGVEIVLTSDRDFYAKFDNGFSNSTNGRLTAEFSGTAEIHTFDLQNNPVKVEAQQLSRGSYYSFINGDPTLVTVLDTADYTDTILWNTPPIPTDPMTGQTFQHWVPIICPTADLPRATLDGTPLALTGARASVINGSAFSAIDPSVNAGEHRLVSPDPIFALVTGFNNGDAYSFMPGTVGTEPRRDTIAHTLLLRADPAQTCDDFTIAVTLATPIQDSEYLISLTIPITYDPSTLHLIAVQPGAIPNDGNYTVDSSTPGFLTVTIYGHPIITGSDLFKIVFEGWKSVAATSVGKNATPSYCGDDAETLTMLPVTFAVAPTPDSLERRLLFATNNASICQPFTIVITTDSLVRLSDHLVLAKIEATFDAAREHFIGSKRGPLLTNVFYTESGQAMGDYQLLVTSPPVLSGSDSLIALQFDPQAISASDMIHVRIFYLECGDTLTRDTTLIFPVLQNVDTAHTMLTIVTSSVSLSDQALADIAISGLPGTADVKQFDLYLRYDHDVLTYDHTDLSGTLTGTWPMPTNTLGVATDTLHFTSLVKLGTVQGALAHVWFRTYVADSSYSPIAVGSSFIGTNAGCPTIFTAPEVSTLFVGENLCGDSLLRGFLESKPLFDVESIVPNPASGNITVSLARQTASPIAYELYDALGQRILAGPDVRGTSLQLDVSGVPSGIYYLRFSAEGYVQSRSIEIKR